MSKKSKIKTRTRISKPAEKADKIKPGFDKTLWNWLVPVLLLTGIAFAPMLGNGFTNWDDDVYVTKNPLLGGPDWNGIFTGPSASNYHPLTILTLAFNYAISGYAPFSYHFLNWLLHILNTALVFLFIYNISAKKVFVAAFSALIFGIHPMHVESVAWISERKDVLYTLFFLLALIQYWNFLTTGKQAKLVWCFLFFALSALSKPAAIVLPLVLLLLDYWNGRTFGWKTSLEKIPFIVVSLVIGFVTIKVQSADAIAGFDIYPLWTRVFFACYTLMIYAARFFIPYPLSAFHPYPTVGDFGLTLWLSPVFIIALIVLLWLRRNDRLFVFSILFFVVNLLLVIQVVSIGLTIVSERYTYVPYIGLSFLAGMWLNKYFNSSLTTYAKAGVIAVAAIFGFITFQRTKVWKDGDSLWASVIRHNPNAATPRSNHADHLRKVAVLPENAARRDELLLEALEDCNVAIRVKPTHIKAHENRQNIYLQLKRDTLALADANVLLGMQPSNASALYTKGFVYMRFNMADSSLFWFNKSVAMNPNGDWILNARGTLLFNNFKRYNEAVADFTRAIELNPQGEYYFNRSSCYFRLGDIAKAKSDALIAIQKNFAIPNSYRTALQL